METTEKTIEVLNDLMMINNDRAAGLEKAAAALGENDQDLKPIFEKMAHESSTNSLALAGLVSRLGGEVAPDTSVKGSLHRTWLQVEAFFTGNDRATILAECERGEDAIVGAYRDALANKSEIDQQIAGAIAIQQGSIVTGHNTIKLLRDQSKNGNQGNPAVDGENKLNPSENENSLNSNEYAQKESTKLPDNNTIIIDEAPQQFTFQDGSVSRPVVTDFNNRDNQPTGTKDEEMPAAGNSKLKEFFIDQLKDLLWAENKLVDTLPKMAEAATSTHLREAFQSHLAQTNQHVARLEQIFGVLGEEVDTTKCDAMAGIVDEGEDIIDETDEGTAQRDVGLIFAGQKVEHYEIASYGGMVTLAKTLGYDSAATILSETLAEEKQADSLLSDIAVNNVNYKASTETKESGLFS